MVGQPGGGKKMCKSFPNTEKFSYIEKCLNNLHADSQNVRVERCSPKSEFLTNFVHGKNGVYNGNNFVSNNNSSC